MTNAIDTCKTVHKSLKWWQLYQSDSLNRQKIRVRQSMHRHKDIPMKSMTAFFIHPQSFDWGALRWEMRSVNHRYLELHLKLPDTAKALEPAIRETIKPFLARGKVELQLHLSPTQNTQNFSLNQPLLSGLTDAINQIQTALPEATQVNPVELLKWPGLVETDVENSVHTDDILAALNNGLSEFDQIRQREGEALSQFIHEKLQAMREHVTQARQLLPGIRQHYADQLKQRIAEHTDTLDEGRFHQEIAIQAQKMDVAEELDRLETHLNEVERLRHEPGLIGRRLDFLMQELNREANTLGAKSIDSRTAQIGVELKVLIEQIREQVQNIE
jgi:uncharacterized protein (TIGR00255 family)